MLDADNNALIARNAEKDLCLLPEMANRHGLITGATGTGKTVTLQTLAETFSALGVPVFLTDIKGDLAGVCRPGQPEGKVAGRISSLGLRDKGYVNRGFPVCFWDVFGEQGHPLRATVSETGPLLLSRLLNLNDVQSGVMSLIFRIADDAGLLLLDMKDLRLMARYAGEHRSEYATRYGNISIASVGAIQRGLLRLEEQGGERFFGEPALEITDLLRTDADGRGVINILAADKLMRAPAVYATTLLWLLSELFERLPEAGDTAKPRLVFFFDEAHLLFNNTSPALLEKIEQVVRLIRSRGVGIFFVTQSPADVPDRVSAQLGNRVQHALRAFTPKEQKNVRAAAQSLRSNPALDAEQAITRLEVGEALVSFLDRKGAPQVVERAYIVPPEGKIGPITPEERAEVLRTSAMAGRYDREIDRESAYELLTARAEQTQRETALLEDRRQAENAAREQERLDRAREKAELQRRKEEERMRKNDPLNSLFTAVAKQATRTITTSVGREVGKTLMRGLLGGLFGKR